LENVDDKAFQAAVGHFRKHGRSFPTPGEMDDWIRDYQGEYNFSTEGMSDEPVCTLTTEQRRHNFREIGRVLKKETTKPKLYLMKNGLIEIDLDKVIAPF